MSTRPTDTEISDFLKELLSYSDANLAHSPKDPLKVRAGRARCMIRAKELLTRLEPQTFRTDFERSVQNLDLPVRLSNMLVNEGILTVADVLKCSQIDLLKLPGCGRHSLKALNTALAEYGGLEEYIPRRAGADTGSEPGM